MEIQTLLKKLHWTENSEPKPVWGGIKTPWHMLTQVLYGGFKPHLILVAGRPGMGKSSFIKQLVAHMALDQDLSVAWFSLKSPAVEGLARINAERMCDKCAEKNKWCNQVRQHLEQAKLYISEGAQQNVAEMFGGMDEAGFKPDIIFIDHLEWIRLPAEQKYSANKSDLIGIVTKQLVAEAKERNIPIVLAVQLNRDCEKQLPWSGHARPNLSHLRDSGNLEQDAQEILFLYRHEVYEPNSKHYKGKAEIIVAKHRNGPVGTVPLTWEGEYYGFYDD